MAASGRPAFLGLDVGGTGAKAGVFDDRGRLLGFARRTYVPETPGEGWAEIDIQHIHDAAREAALEASRQAGDARSVALSIASMGQTFVPLDAEDRPLHPAILWYDSRAAVEAAELAHAVQASDSHQPTHAALVVGAIATASKIAWLRRHRPDRAARARRFLLVPDYLAYRLTGEPVIDPNTAASTGFYSEDRPGYEERMLQAAGVDVYQLSRVQMPGSPIGRVKPGVAEEWGLAPGALLVTGTNDQYAGALGAGNCRPGILSETTGTCLALVTLAERLPSPLPPGLLGGRYPIQGYWFALAYAKTAGLVVEWFQRQFRPDQPLADLERLAASSPPGSRGVTVLPHFDGIFSPEPNAAARGAVLNLTLNHTLADVYRAILESIAYSLRENIELLRQTGFELDVVRSIGGGARSALWLQIKADAVGLPIQKPAVSEAAVLGAAMLAAVGYGAFSSLAESSARLVSIERVFEPRPACHAAYEEPYQAYRCLRRQLYGGPA